VIMPALVNACQRRTPAPNNACPGECLPKPDACHRPVPKGRQGPGAGFDAGRLCCWQACKPSRHVCRAGVAAEQACVPRQARPPTTAKPAVATADPLRLQPGSARACAAKQKGPRIRPGPRKS
jgi:hypothetical protein